MTLTKLRQLSVLFLALTLAACGSQPASKYPYPPQFVSSADVTINTLAAPPQPGSAQYKKEIKDIIARQAKLTPEQITAIQDEIHIRPEMLVEPVLGAQFNRENLPKLYTLLDHAESDSWRIGDAIQERWNETRPWLADPRVKRYVEEIHRPGYPSGHTTTNMVWALILSDMAPKHDDGFVSRAWQIGQHRVDGGAHFPHDIEAGKRLARIIYAHMRMVPQFGIEQHDAQVELDAFVIEQIKEGKLSADCCILQTQQGDDE